MEGRLVGATDGDGSPADLTAARSHDPISGSFKVAGSEAAALRAQVMRAGKERKRKR